MKHNNGLTVKALLISFAILSSAAILGAQGNGEARLETWAAGAHYSSISLAMGYNTFSLAGDSWYAQQRNLLKNTGGFALAMRVLLSPNILGHFLSFGGEYQSLSVASYDSSYWYYVDTGEATVETAYAEIWQFLVGMMFVNNKNMILQGQFGYGSWSTGKEYGEFSEPVASARLVAAFPLGTRLFTFDPEIAYYKGLGAYKNSAFSVQLGLSFRF